MIESNVRVATLAFYFKSTSSGEIMQNVIDINTKSQAKDKSGINWDTLIALSVFHILAVVALFYFSWANLAAFLILWWVAGSLGTGLAFHRLLTHRGFKVPKWLEYSLTFCGNLALQSGAVKWVTTHRIHHGFTEQEGDPHSPRDGTFWAHVGWVLKGRSQEHDEATFKKYVPDLLKDPVHVFLSKYYWVAPIIAGIPLYFIGGWSMILWGIALRTVFGWHMTWLVNSATHIWGTRRFETTDDSTNNGLIALVTWGEGWHNNHHAYPTSARHGLAWYEVDFNWWALSVFKMLGLATDIKVIELVEEKPVMRRAA